MSNDPLARLPEAATFDVHSDDIADGGVWAASQVAGAFGVEGGLDQSPHLR